MRSGFARGLFVFLATMITFDDKITHVPRISACLREEGGGCSRHAMSQAFDVVAQSDELYNCEQCVGDYLCCTTIYYVMRNDTELVEGCFF